MFSKKNLTVSEIDDLADFIGITNADNYGMYITKNIVDKMNKEYENSENFLFFGLYFDLTKFFLKPSSQIEDYFKYKTVKILNKNSKKINMVTYFDKEINMLSYFHEILKEKKNIFINLDLHGYGHTDGEPYPYDIHSMILILIPVENNYKALLINPHARDITYNYQVVYSNKRIKNIYYKEGIDCEFMDMFIGNLNKYLKKRSNTKILFEKTNKYVYRGVNLQCGDSRGYCYMFPFVLFHYFRQYYYHGREVEGIKFNNSYSLLKDGNFDEFIANCIVNYCKPYKDKLKEIGCDNIKNNYDDFEYILCKQDFRLFKNIASTHLTRCEKIFWDLKINNS